MLTRYTAAKMPACSGTRLLEHRLRRGTVAKDLTHDRAGEAHGVKQVNTGIGEGRAVTDRVLINR